MKKIGISLVLLFALVSLGLFAQAGSEFFPMARKAFSRPNKNHGQHLDPSVESRIDGLIKSMTLDEKLSLLSGVDDFNTRAIPRLGVPAIKMTDGPLGVRAGKPATAFPAAIALAASFDPSLVGEYGKSIAQEAKYFGKNMLLGPCVNISRNPFGGRNFESFGEDPYLTSRLAVAYVKSVQGEHVLATTKHFALNDQEFERFTVDVRADTRGMFEIHLPAFEAAVRAGTWSIMSSYNKLNGDWASENDILLNKILKGMWAFKGFVVSDWVSVHSSAKAANAGLDIEMPSGEFFGDKLRQAIENKEVSVATIDDKVRRILRAMIGIGIMDNVGQTEGVKGPDSSEHQAFALRAAQQSIVLLKNEGGLLPLNAGSLKRIAVIGPNSSVLRAAGGGSSQVDPYHLVSPLAALVSSLPEGVELVHAIGDRVPGDYYMPEDAVRTSSGAPGLTGEYFANRDLTGEPLVTRVDHKIDFNWDSDFPAPGMPRVNFSVRWTGQMQASEDGDYEFVVKADDGSRLFLNDLKIMDDWKEHGPQLSTVQVKLKKGQSYQVRLEYFQAVGGAEVHFAWHKVEDEMAKAIAAARTADVVLVFAGLTSDFESEGIDRTTLELPGRQSELIANLVKVNPKTVVVVNSGTPYVMDAWLNRVPALVQAWYPGQEGGTALADVIFGRVNPSGKLPISLIQRWEDSSAFPNYPGEKGRVEYAEGIMVGYRHLDTKNIAPNFPFGFGLSYTQFAFSNLRVAAIDGSTSSTHVNVKVDVTNTGARAGAEVAQLYVGEASPSVIRPPQELKGFQKVFLKPGETQTVEFTLNKRAFAYYNDRSMNWQVNAGEFNIRVGNSSRDIRAETRVKLQ